MENKKIVHFYYIFKNNNKINYMVSFEENSEDIKEKISDWGKKNGLTILKIEIVGYSIDNLAHREGKKEVENYRKKDMNEQKIKIMKPELKLKLQKIIKEEYQKLLAEDDRWIQKATKDSSKGNLHKALGIPVDEKIGITRMNKELAALKKKYPDGGYSKGDLKLQRMLQAAINMQS